MIRRPYFNLVLELICEALIDIDFTQKDEKITSFIMMESYNLESTIGFRAIQTFNRDERNLVQETIYSCLVQLVNLVIEQFKKIGVCDVHLIKFRARSSTILTIFAR